jgi:hypothetical protein
MKIGSLTTGSNENTSIDQQNKFRQLSEIIELRSDKKLPPTFNEIEKINQNQLHNRNFR